MNKCILLQNAFRPILVPFRTCSSDKKSPKPIEYYGFTYYPRHENFKDPPYKPSKLFLIKRLGPTRGLNPEERKTLGHLNIDGPKQSCAHVNIVKNIPEINALLWKVKHLIEIKPITWEGELPKDCLGTHLRDTGELIISPELKVSEDVLKQSEKFEKNKFPPGYLKGYLLQRWQKGVFDRFY